MADENAAKEAVEDIVDQVALSDEFEAVLGASPPNAEEQFEISKDDEAALLENESEGGDQHVEANENVEKVAEKDEEALSNPATEEDTSNTETQKDAAELRKDSSVEKEIVPEADVEDMEAVEAQNDAVPNEEAVPKPANDAEERPPQAEDEQNVGGDAAPAPPPPPNAAPDAAVPLPPPAVHNLPPLQLRQITEAELLFSERMPDIERNERWRSYRPYTYPKREEGPSQNHRKSLLQLLHPVAEELGQPLEQLLGTPEGRMKANEFIKGETAYVPEMLMYITIDHVAGQDAHGYRLHPSRGKPPFSTAESSLAVICERKSLPLRSPDLNVIVTSYGCWPAERIFLNEFAVLKRNAKKVEDWRTNRYDRKRSFPETFECEHCGHRNKLGPRH